MKIDVEKSDANSATIALEIEADKVNVEYNKVCKRLSQRLNIPGFRRGKAPRQVVEKAVGVDRIKQEVLERLLPTVFADAISEHQLDIVAPPQVDEYKFETGSPLVVKASVELRPDVKLPDLTTVKVDVPKFERGDDALDEELNIIVERMTTLEPVVDRAATDTDFVNINFSGTVEGQAIRGGSAKNYMLDLANSAFIEGFAEQVAGHKIGEEFKVNVTFPGDYHDSQLAGKPAEFQVTINEIKEKVVPELDDDLARKCGPYESLEQLKTEVGKFIDNKVDYENEFRKQKAIIDALVDAAEVDVPDSMVNREAKVLQEEVQQRFKAQGLNWEQFVDQQGGQSIWDNLRDEALRRVQTSLTFGAVAKDANIVVTEAEFHQEIAQLAREKGMDEKQAMRQLANNAQAAQSLNDLILSRKIIAYLLERVEVNYVDAPDEADEGASQASGAAVASALEQEEYEVLSED
ncbi:MAG: trigger factor [Vampirovibrionales bacterium]|nr:trigger factor [Cyanobacteria bacterium HKST-UBA03]